MTASRRCTEQHRLAIRRALLTEFECVARYIEPEDVIVVHGAQGHRCRGKTVGGDLIAHEEAIALGMTPEPHPADWDGCVPSCRPGHRKVRWDGTWYCPTGGFRRNQDMVDTGVDVCCALPLGASPGTRDCMRRARAAGVPVRIIRLLGAEPQQSTVVALPGL